MKLFNDQATAAVASLDSADVAYCAKLEQRFAHMGICLLYTSPSPRD